MEGLICVHHEGHEVHEEFEKQVYFFFVFLRALRGESRFIVFHENSRSQKKPLRSLRLCERTVFCTQGA